MPDVHPRLRKRLARCTLDCGFKTSESPALRGFVGGPRALATAALYLVLKSNGLHRPKIWLKKFGFSLKSVPANVAKKLPSQRCSKPLLIAFQLLSQTAHVRFHRRKRVHTRLSEKDCTQGLTRRNTGHFRWGALLLPSERFARFGNPAWPGIKTANFAAFGSWSEALLKNAESLRDSDALMRVTVPRRRGPAELRRPTPPAERTVLAPISPRVQLCLRRPAFPLSAFIPEA